MAYEGSVTLISGIKQANNQNFPLVDAPAVRITDDKRLPDALEELSEEIIISSEEPTEEHNKLWIRDQGGGEYTVPTSAEMNTALNLKADKADPEFTGSISMGRKSETTIGYQSIAVGFDAEASGSRSSAFGLKPNASGAYSHCEGSETESSGSASHCEGAKSVASGNYSHAENYQNTASGIESHAEGRETTASGKASHSEGMDTVANHRSQHVFGENNVEDPSSEAADQRGNYVEIVGNGHNHLQKSNARALDWNGNEYLKSDLYVGCNDDSSGGTKVAKITDLPDVSTKANIANPVFTGSISMGRVSESNKKTGTNSSALGNNVRAMGAYSNVTGDATIGMSASSHVFGEYNIPEAEEWQPNKTYHVGDIYVRYNMAAGQIVSVLYFKCNTDHISSSDLGNDYAYWDNISSQKLKYAEIVGNGYAEIDDQTFVVTEHRSNARVLDWDGNEYLNGDLYVGCNADSSGGSKVLTSADLPVVINDNATYGATQYTWSADKLFTNFSKKTIYKFTFQSGGNTGTQDVTSGNIQSWSGSARISFTDNARVIGYKAEHLEYLKNLTYTINPTSFQYSVTLRPGATNQTLEFYVAETEVS